MLVMLALLVGVQATETVDPVRSADLTAIQDGVFRWVQTTNADVAPEAGRLWDELAAMPSSQEQMDRLLQILFLTSSVVRDVVAAVESDRWDDVQLDDPELAQSATVATNVRLFLAKLLIEVGAFEESEQALEATDERLCIDPATLVFCRAVCLHSRLDKEAGVPVIKRLLDPASQVPERYQAVARLMLRDLEDLDDNDLAKTAQQMKNLQQKLQRGKSGKKTQEQEQEILEGLDKMIEKLEQQQQQAQGQGGQPGQSNNPDKPADDSRIAGQTGPGEVDRKPIGKSSGWGNLPEKSRTEARNLINRQFPSHYRKAVEEYLKKLAERPAK